jgi:hypothetical protein
VCAQVAYVIKTTGRKTAVPAELALFPCFGLLKAASQMPLFARIAETAPNGGSFFAGIDKYAGPPTRSLFNKATGRKTVVPAEMDLFPCYSPPLAANSNHRLSARSLRGGNCLYPNKIWQVITFKQQISIRNSVTPIGTSEIQA